MPEAKRGIVYIAAWPEEWLAEWADDTPRYHGYWDSGSEPGENLGDGPGWDDAEEAITWGRERAPKVIIRIGTQHYSAGEEDPEGQQVPRWESR